MNLIKMEEQEIKMLAEKLHTLRKTGMNNIVILDILNELMQESGRNIIKFDIDNSPYPICFNANDVTIYLSKEKLNQTINNSIKALKRIFPNINEEEMYNYYILFALTHETRHVNQFLIAEEKIEAPYKIIQQVYKTMINIEELEINFIKRFITDFIYCAKNNRFVIERNANIEACEIIKSIAEHEGNKEIANVFNETRQKNMMYGYDDRYNGSIEETYKRLYLTSFYKKLPIGEAIPIRDRILYGLPINEDTKKKVLENKY